MKNDTTQQIQEWLKKFQAKHKEETKEEFEEWLDK